jgi:hypothetical protein
MIGRIHWDRATIPGCSPPSTIQPGSATLLGRYIKIAADRLP